MTQSSLLSFVKPNLEDVLEEFDKQVRPKRVYRKPTIALPHGDDCKSIDWDSVNKSLLYPCFEATKLPIGEARDLHCSKCSKCKDMISKLDKRVKTGNKWLDGSLKTIVTPTKKAMVAMDRYGVQEEIDWEI